MSALNAITDGLELMCRWAGWNDDEVIADAPSALTYGIPDANVIRSIIEGLGGASIPLSVIHRYLIGSGLLDQTVSLNEYLDMLVEDKGFLEKHGLMQGQEINPNKPLNQQAGGTTSSTTKEDEEKAA